MKENEIRPAEIFDKYLELTISDTKMYFSDGPRNDGSCPACAKKGEFAFNKSGFDYQLCQECQTLFVNPRPLAVAFEKYYTESLSSEYWASTFYKETASARRQKLWKPKARMVDEKVKKYSQLCHPTIVDIGGGYGIFAEEMQLITGKKPVVIEPGPGLASACREKEIPVVEKFLEAVTQEDLPSGSKVFVSFELFEHLHAPENFLNHLLRLMSSGDLFIFTTLSGTGVDILALWEDSKSVSPPHHLNFLNPLSARILLERVGFEVPEITTPGKLDIDILCNNKEKIKDRFWKTFISQASEAEKDKWQEHIEASGWSSHMMIVCRKP